MHSPAPTRRQLHRTLLAGFGALQMGALVERFGGGYARAGASIVLVCFIGLVAVWFAPETRDQPLPDSLTMSPDA